MIPKKIHYVWLGVHPPLLIKRCIDSWYKVMPDYEIKCWDNSRLPEHHWIRETISVQKYGLAVDYLRHYILYSEGGIYLDADVFVQKRFDKFLSNNFFTAIEYNAEKFNNYNNGKINEKGEKSNPHEIVQGLTIQAGIVGSVPANKILIDMMHYYDQNHFIDNNGNMNYTHLGPDAMALSLEKYGFKYRNKYQDLGNGIVIYDTNIFASSIKISSKESYAIHLYLSSWKDYSLLQTLIVKIKAMIKNILLAIKTLNRK